MKKIDRTNTIKSIIVKYPGAKDVFIANGLADLVEDDKLDKVGSFLTLESALKIKGKDLNAFIKMLAKKINTVNDGIDITLAEKGSTQWDVIGHLPLPVRLQILEAFEDFRVQLHREMGFSLSEKFAAGREGKDLIEKICAYDGKPEVLPDIVFSEGFDCLFGLQSRERFIDSGIFGKALPWAINTNFKGAGLKDPDSKYNILGVIPAVFVIDKHALDGRPAPRTWEDLLDQNKGYENTIVISDRSVAVFKSVILTLYARFGEKGVRSLARNTTLELHPSQIVKLIASEKKERPAIFILPYFFSRMVCESREICVIWPEDGAIVAPIYMLVKSDPKFYKTDPQIVEHTVNFFSGRQMGTIFTKGHFPSLHPEVNNALPAEASFQWIGWEFLDGMDSGAVIPHIYNLFDEEMTRTECK